MHHRHADRSLLPLTCDKGRPAQAGARTNCRQIQHWTDNLPGRLARHQAGHGSRLIAVITAAGIGFTLARTTSGDRATERAIKNAGGAVRYCPLCTTRPLNGRWS